MALVGGFLLLVLALAAIAGLVAVVSMGVGLVVRAIEGEGAERTEVCGACGYPTRGLTGTACPECGEELSDRTVARVVRPKGGAAVLRRVVWVSAGATLLLVAVAVVAGLVARWYGIGGPSPFTP